LAGLQRLKQSGIDLTGLRDSVPTFDQSRHGTGMFAMPLSGSRENLRSYRQFIPTQTTQLSTGERITQHVPETSAVLEQARRDQYFDQQRTNYALSNSRLNPNANLGGVITPQQIADMRARGTLGGQQPPAAPGIDPDWAKNLTDDQRKFFGMIGASSAAYARANPNASREEVKQGVTNQFYSGMMDKYYKGELTQDQQQRVLGQTNNPNLSAGQRAQLSTVQSQDALMNTKGSGNKKEFRAARDTWINDIKQMETQDPNSFAQWADNNPEWATRYYGSMATGRYGGNKKDYAKKADAAAYRQGIDAGYGKDGKRDGKAFASGYGKSWGDINNENGPGDFFKIGTPSKMKGGFNDFVEDNPWKVAGAIAATVVAPQATSFLIAQGMNPVLAGALVQAGSTAVQGGDIKDVALSGATGAFGEFVKTPGAFGDLGNKLPEGAIGFAGEGTDFAVEGGDIVRDLGKGMFDQVVEGINYDVANPTPKVVWQDHGTSDVLGDVQVQVPDYQLPQPDEAAGGGGGDEGAAGDPGAADPSTPVEGQVEMPPEIGQGEAEDDDWTWNGTVLTNQRTGEEREIPNPGRMQEGVVYNGDAEPKGDPEGTEEAYGWLTTDTLVDLIENIPGIEGLEGPQGAGDGTGGAGSGTGGTGTGTGGGLDFGGAALPGTGGGSGGGSGGGTGTGTGTGTGPGEGTGEGGGENAGEEESMFGTAIIAATQQRRDLFDYTKITPAMTAVLGPFINQVTGERHG
jgi:hypothetical protein